jgi:hypothetical protein
MFVLATIVDQQQQAGAGQAVHQAVEQRLGFGVDPLQVFEHQQQRLDLRFAQQQAPGPFQRARAAQVRIEPRPGGIVERDVEQRQQRRQRRLERAVQAQHFAHDLVAHAARVVARIDLEVGAQQVDHRAIRGGLAVGHRCALQHQPWLRPRRTQELPEQPRLAHARLADHRDDLPVAALRAPLDGGAPRGLGLATCSMRAAR